MTSYLENLMITSPLTLIINHQPIEIGNPLPDRITSLVVHLFMNMQIPSSQAPLIKAWLNSVIDRLDCDYVTYNGTLIPAHELKKF